MSYASEKSIFLAALERESGRQREDFLDEACAGDSRLRADVGALLRAYELPENVLDEIPTAVGTARAAADADHAAWSAKSPEETADFPPLSESAGTLIGPYRLMEQIGEGGFGLVFVAEQQQPVRRKVALKIVKPGMDSREVIARFEAERQALALMDHPHIARVLDAGETASGRPYFVMELVRGVPITEFCDRHRLSSRQRLELFIHVCHAVAHAHFKGVIHRDLKPSNVLVTLHDGVPVPKVIDFGVAKAIGPQLTDKTLYTRFAQLIGTPLYMSPEQAEMSGLDVDTRSDIYSLGVLLYELLTGTTPFDRRQLQTAGFDEIRRIIREHEPPRPSTRLATLGEALSTVSQQRHTEPRLLAALVRNDLDWIVMKALDKDRARRYQTAAAFADDVRRFLDEEPIEARPPSAAYRFRKFARRNKAVLTTGALVALSLLVGTAVSIWQAVRASLARADADASRIKAEQFAERLKEANVLLDGARALADEQQWPGAWADYTKATELQPDHYLAWSGRGALDWRLGLWRQAASDFGQALDLGAPANNPGWWGVPQLFWYAGDRARYGVICRQLAEPSARPADELNASFTLRALLIGPASEGTLADLAGRAEDLVAQADRPPGGPPFGDRPPPGPPPGRPDRPGPRADGSPRPPGPFRGFGVPRGVNLYTAGLAHYRAGDWPKAIERLRQSTESDARWSAGPIAYPLLAMAYHRAGQGEAARQALEQATVALGRWLDEALAGQVGALPIPWFDWVEFLCFYREAHQLIDGASPAPDGRLAALEARALAAIGQ